MKLIYEMADKIGLLQEEIARLKEQLHEKGKGSGTTANIPSFVKANKKKKKVQARKKRTTAYTRHRETPTETIFHTVESCTDCGGSLGKPTVGLQQASN